MSKHSTVRRLLHWTPRVMGALVAALLTVIFVGSAVVEPLDPDPPLPLADAVGLLLMGVTVVGLVIGWRSPIVGGLLVFPGLVAPLVGLLKAGGSILMAWPLAVPALVGVLYVVDGWLARRDERRGRSGGAPSASA